MGQERNDPGTRRNGETEIIRAAGRRQLAAGRKERNGEAVTRRDGD